MQTGIPQSHSNEAMQLRRVAGCIPVLLAPFHNNPLQRLRDCPQNDLECMNRIDLTGSKLLFINSRKNPGYYVFPKGGLKRGEDPEKAALRETLEETGVEGEVFDSIKGHNWHWFMLSINKVHDDWLEKDQRERVWVPYEEARHFKPVTKSTRKLIKKLKHRYKRADGDKSPSSSSSSSSDGD